MNRYVLHCIALLASFSITDAADLTPTEDASREPERVSVTLLHPPVDPPPKVTVAEALRIGSAFAAKKRPDIAEFYVDRVWLSYHPRNKKRCWMISFASPRLLFFFAIVYMDGRAALPPKNSGLFPRSP